MDNPITTPTDNTGANEEDDFSDASGGDLVLEPTTSAAPIDSPAPTPTVAPAPPPRTPSSGKGRLSVTPQVAQAAQQAQPSFASPPAPIEPFVTAPAAVPISEGLPALQQQSPGNQEASPATRPTVGATPATVTQAMPAEMTPVVTTAPVMVSVPFTPHAAPAVTHPPAPQPGWFRTYGKRAALYVGSVILTLLLLVFALGRLSLSAWSIIDAWNKSHTKDAPTSSGSATRPMASAKQVNSTSVSETSKPLATRPSDDPQKFALRADETWFRVKATDERCIAVPPRDRAFAATLNEKWSNCRFGADSKPREALFPHRVTGANTVHFLACGDACTRTPR